MLKALADRTRNALAESPLREAAFRTFYAGAIGTALGYTMQATMASWLMATLTPSALMVALVQTASTLPTLLFGLIAGALSDIADRRRVILVTQIVMLVAVALLGAATLGGAIGPAAVLLLSFVVGCGFTFYLPAQQASIHALVSRAELPRAVALSAVAFNVARAAGPALAGALAAALSAGSALLISALAFVSMIGVVARWRPREPVLPGVPERLLAGVRSGLQYAWHSQATRALIVRNLSFSICASAFWALLPVIARDLLGLGAGGFGLLSAAFGLGAVGGASTIAQQLRRRSLNAVVTTGVLTWVVAIALMVVSTVTAIAVIGAGLAGAAWVYVLAGLSAGTQSSAPAWVRARAVAMNIVATQACLAVGSALWGSVATLAGIRSALAASAVALLLLHCRLRYFHVDMGTEADVLPRAQLPELSLQIEPMPDDGPVLIQIDYRIEAHRQAAFLAAITAVGPTRRRNGAASWRIFRDLGDEERIVERYVIASWADYLRQRGRMTLADSQLQEAAARFQRPDVPIRISRFIGAEAPAAADEAAARTPPG